MPQSFDPISYYAQFYGSGMDSDGRSSPLNSAGAVNKDNGTSQSSQEVWFFMNLICSLLLILLVKFVSGKSIACLTKSYTEIINFQFMNCIFDLSPKGFIFYNL